MGIHDASVRMSSGWSSRASSRSKASSSGAVRAPVVMARLSRAALPGAGAGMGDSSISEAISRQSRRSATPRYGRSALASTTADLTGRSIDVIR